MAPSLVTSDAVSNYVGGVVTRERERLAAIFEAHGMPEIAAEIKDRSNDREVFAWIGRKTIDWSGDEPQSVQPDSPESSSGS